MNWWSRNAESIEAGAAVATALVALVALVGVKFQLDETDRLQQTQSARDAYRAHLALASSSPQFARTLDGCLLIASRDGGAYEAYVDHLLYSAEQMLAVSVGWQATFMSELSVHTDYICSTNAPLGYTEDTTQLLNTFRENTCPEEPTCK